MKIKLKHKILQDRDDIFCLAIILYYVWQILNLFIQKGLFGNKILLIANYGVLAFAIGMICICYVQRETAKFMLGELGALVVFLCSYLYGYAQTSVLLYNMIWLMGVCIPLGYAFGGIRDRKKIYTWLYKLAKPAVTILFVTYVLEFKVWHVYLGEYDMALSYAMLLSCTILCNEVFEHACLKDIVCLMAGVGVNILYGCRGANVCFALFLVCKVLWDIKPDTKRYSLIFVGMLLVGIGVIVLLLVVNSGIDTSRTIRFRGIQKLLSGEFLKSEGRNSLYSYYFELFQERPFAGWGVCGMWPDGGNYPHNIVIEILISFGSIVGGGILLILALGVFAMFRNSRKTERMLLCIYLANAAGLIISGTFLQNPTSYICMGIVIGQSYMGKKRYLNTQERYVGD